MGRNDGAPVMGLLWFIGLALWALAIALAADLADTRK